MFVFVTHDQVSVHIPAAALRVLAGSRGRPRPPQLPRRQRPLKRRS